MDPDIVYDLHDHPMIDYIEIPLPFKIQLACFTNDSYVRSSTQITPWGVDMVKAPQAWNVTKGSGAKVYVIDTGMEDHVDLPDRPSENCGGLFDGCSDGPIYHGTHVSGTLMALDNDIGVVGVSPALNDNDVYSWAACCPSTGSCYSNNIAAGIDAAILDEVDVINMSFGGPSQHTGVANAVAVAWNNGIVMVAAAGNLPESEQGGDPVYPAGHTQVIGVSGLKSDGSFANTSPCIIPSYNEALKSNHGPHVEISAPFWALSTVGTNQYEDENDGWCGTSMAAPHVAGVVALMKSLVPELSPSQIRNHLHNSADKVRGMRGQNFTPKYGYGRLNALQAIEAIFPKITGPIQVCGPAEFDIVNTEYLPGGFNVSWSWSPQSPLVSTTGCDEGEHGLCVMDNEPSNNVTITASISPILIGKKI